MLGGAPVKMWLDDKNVAVYLDEPILGMWLVQMAISTKHIYQISGLKLQCFEITGPDIAVLSCCSFLIGQIQEIWSKIQLCVAVD